MTINSVSNPLVKEIVRLRKAGERKERALVVIDGARETALAVRAGWEIDHLFYCAELAKPEGQEAANFLGLSQEKIVEVSAAVFRKICYKEKPEGWLAVAKLQSNSLTELKLSANPLLVVLEKVEKPGNLGAILRTAYAAGVTAVIINDSQTDIYNPNVIRASEGQIFNQDVIIATKEETVNWLKDKKVRTLGAATSGSKNYTATDLSGPLALVLGSEAEGLSQFWLKNAEGLIKIPMRPGIDSLNVSVSAAIIIFEALRQRGLN
jgi:TrmH family RNA methyltransferase